MNLCENPIGKPYHMFKKIQRNLNKSIKDFSFVKIQEWHTSMR